MKIKQAGGKNVQFSDYCIKLKNWVSSTIKFGANEWKCSGFRYGHIIPEGTELPVPREEQPGQTQPLQKIKNPNRPLVHHS